MPSAKDLRVAPVSAAAANALVKRVHYSGKVVQNSQLHLGVFLDGRLEGAMQFGPSLDKRKLRGLVAGTGWNDFIELNRMAFSEALPRNSESRALAVAMRLLRKRYPHLRWVVSFADGTQCGDGTIYRASGFVLTGIRKNTPVWAAPGGEQFSEHALRNVDGHTRKHAQAQRIVSKTTLTKDGHTAISNGGASMAGYRQAGFRPLPGFQLRYLYFLDPSARGRLTVPVIPFEEIGRRGAAMYRGQKRVGSSTDDAPSVHEGEGGLIPTPTLQTFESGTE